MMSKLIPLEVADAAVERLQLEIKRLTIELKQKEELHEVLIKQLKDMYPKVMVIAEKVSEHNQAINLLADGIKKRDRDMMYLHDVILDILDDAPDSEDNTDE